MQSRKACLGDRNISFNGITGRGTLIVAVLPETSEESKRLSGQQGQLKEASGGVAEIVDSRVDLSLTLGGYEHKAETESGPESEEENDGLGT